MKKVLSSLIVTVMATICIFANLSFTNVTAANTYTQDAKGNWYWGYKSQLNSSYYDGLDQLTDNKTAFENKLHTIISTGVKKYSYKSTTAQLEYLDADPNNESRILCLYSGQSMTSGWNKEHTWAKSHGFPSESFDAYSDINHLRATDSGLNSTRGNCDFGELNHSTAKSAGYGNYVGSGLFEPRDCVKGDVARIMMYMDVRYNGDSLSDGLTLTLTNDKTTSTSTNTGKFGNLSTLIKWHEQDPVDDLERRRNDRAFERQKNRNPFIDHPEYANVIYNANYDGSGSGSGGNDPTPSTYTVTYSVPNTATFSYKDTKKYNANEVITAPTSTPAPNNGYRFVGWFKDSSYTTAFDFNNYKITKNTTIYAKIEKIPPTLEDNLKALTVKSALSFACTESSTQCQEVVNTCDINKFSGNGAIGDRVSNGDDFSTYATYDTSLFNIKIMKNDSPHFYVNDTGIRLYPASKNGTALEITAIGSVFIKQITPVFDQGENLLTITISEDGKSAKMQNTCDATSGNQVRIKSFSITYSNMNNVVTHTLQEGSLKLNFATIVSKTVYDQAINQGYKFDCYVNNQLVDYVTSMQGSNYYLSTNVNATNNTTTYSVYFKITKNGNQIVMPTVNYSVKTLANAYLTRLSNDTLVKKYKDLLTTLSK